MARITLTIPTLVQDILVEGRAQYYLQPLFLPFPVATNRRYEIAIAQFQKEIKHQFKGFSLSSENSDQLLWYVFRPKIKFRQVFVEITVSGQLFSGLVSVASFELKGITFVCLPNINNYMFAAEPEAHGKVDVEAAVRNTIRKLLKRFKEDRHKDLHLDMFYGGERDFFTEVEVNINLGFGAFRFDKPDDNWYFRRLAGDADFDGETEIEKVASDLNSRYPAELSRAYGQEELVTRIYELVFQKGNTPFVLVGPSGVGKSTLLHEVIRRYQNNHYRNRSGAFQRIWHLDPNRVISGMSIVGMWQKRFEAILGYLQKPEEQREEGDKMLVTNAVALLRIGKSASNSMTLSDVLKPYLEKRLFQLILLATPEEWKVLQENDRRFSDLFQVFRMNEPSYRQAAEIILQKRRDLELESGASITVQAISQLLDIQRNYLKKRALPGSVLDLLQQLTAKYRFGKIDAQTVREEFKAFSGLQEHIFDTAEQFNEGEVDALIAQDLVGQPKVVRALADTVHLIKARLTDQERPISSFLFIGPTGVGKTQAAKVLCKYLMGSEDALLRFDMNEYIEEGAVSRLIGDYYHPEGQLTGRVRYRPFGVLLLDEIEKAHPKVHDLLLQVLDDGRLTDSLGRTVDFSNMIIIMTSNLGSQEVSRQLGYGVSDRAEEPVYRKAVENYFRPEFVNRINQIVVFNPLGMDHILAIARLQIMELLKRDGFVRRTTILNISKEALEWVARRGFDARMGGRALKRQIERDLTTLTADQLISTSGDNPILFDILLEENRLVPQITPLEFVTPLGNDWMPPLPEVERGRSFYGKLLKTIESLEQKIEQLESRVSSSGPMVALDTDMLDWQYYGFKATVSQTKEQIRNNMLGFNDSHFIESPSIPLRLKTGGMVSRRDWSKGVKENLKDQLFQQEALREISEAYQYAAAQFDTIKTEFLNNYFRVAYLSLLGEGFLRKRSDRVCIRFRSCITGLGNREIGFLLDLYAGLLTLLDIHHEVDRKNALILAEGYFLFDLLKGEKGIQLFYIAHRNPLPIQVDIIDLAAADVPKPRLEVLRIFDGNRTVTDLRTGYSNAANITPEEFKVLIFGGIDPKLRRSVLPF